MIYVSDHEYTQKHDIQMSLHWPRIQGGAGFGTQSNILLSMVLNEDIWLELTFYPGLGHSCF